MDWYRKMLANFKWTWLERKGAFHGPRKKEQIATKLARAHAKREVRREIEAQVNDEESGYDYDDNDWDMDELRNWDDYRGITWTPIGYDNVWKN